MHLLAKYLELAHLSPNWRTKILAGCIRFLTIAHIIFVTFFMLADTARPVAAVTTAICLSVGLASIFVGVVAR